MTEKTVKEIENTYEIVKNILKTKPDTRSSDTLLLAYVQKYCKDNELAPISSETITRARRRIQNVQKLYPATKEVQEHRAKKQQEYQKTFQELRNIRMEKRLRDIIKIAHHLGWMERDKGCSAMKMRLSEVEKCMLAMVNDSDLDRMRKWVEDKHG